MNHHPNQNRERIQNRVDNRTCGSVVPDAARNCYAPPKTNQVTGPVLKLIGTTVVVQNGGDSWRVARDPGTKVTGELGVGAKVSIQERCAATDVEVKIKKPEK